jgi:arylsulfatase A-like enzyme
MTDRARWTLAAIAAATGAIAHAAPDNVLVVVLDDVGVELVGCYDAYFQSQGMPAGSPAATPAIDQLLAARGVTFTQAWSCPTCSPTRAAVLTGRMPSRTGIGRYINQRGTANNPGLSTSEVLLPEALAGAPVPYASAAVGKWHLASPAQVALDPRHPLGAPAGRWFDRYAGTLFGVRRDPTVPAAQTGYYSWNKTYASLIQLSFDPCSPEPLPCVATLSMPPVDSYATVDTANDALALMSELPEPWFLYVAFNAIHAPLHDVPAGLPETACGAYAPPAPCDTSAAPTTHSRARCMLQALDTQLARVLCAVDESDTTVIVLGDNGGERTTVLPPYDQNHCKGTVYEGGVRVPMFVRSPLVPAGLVGTRSEALVSVADVFATTCELAGLAATPPTAVDSVSLVPILEGRASDVRDVLYTEGFYPSFEPDPISGAPPASYVGLRHYQAARDARFKLVRKWSRTGGSAGTVTLTEELFDLAQGGAPDLSVTPPAPRPDFFEANELLAGGAPLPPVAAAAYVALAAELDRHVPVVK